MKHARTHRRLLMSKNLILMLVLLVVIFAAVFAWFVQAREVDANNMSVSVRSVDNIELALPERKLDSSGNKVDSFPMSNASWSDTIQFDASGYLANLVKDITSDGKQFVVPNFEAAKGLKSGRKVITDDVWIDGLSSMEALTNSTVNDDDQYNYISVDFYARSKQSNISIEKGSYLAAGCELGYQDSDHPSVAAVPLTGSTTYRPSSYGSGEGNADAFSADAVVGAMRVSLVGTYVNGAAQVGNTEVYQETGYNNQTPGAGETILDVWNDNATKRLIWLPRPDIYLKTDDNAVNWRLLTGIKPSGNTAKGSLSAAQVNSLAEETYTHSFYIGNTISGTGVKKGLTKSRYADTTVKPVTGVSNNDGKFLVSDTRNDSSLGTTGHYPTLGQSMLLGTDAVQTNINFTAVENDNRDTTGYYVYKFRMNIWIEGEDAEARRSMKDGVFSMMLEFGA